MDIITTPIRKIVMFVTLYAIPVTIQLLIVNPASKLKMLFLLEMHAFVIRVTT